MKEFGDFANKVREQASKGNYSLVKRSGVFGAYLLSRQDIFNAGYSLECYAPGSEEAKTILPLSVFINEKFLQDKIFILKCKRLKMLIPDISDKIHNLSTPDLGSIDSGILAFLHFNCLQLNKVLSLLNNENIRVYKDLIKNMRLTYYLKEYSGYDLSSLK